MIIAFFSVWRTPLFLWRLWYPCFRFLIVSALGFRAGPISCGRWIPQIHLLVPLLPNSWEPTWRINVCCPFHGNDSHSVFRGFYCLYNHNRFSLISLQNPTVSMTQSETVWRHQSMTTLSTTVCQAPPWIQRRRDARKRSGEQNSRRYQVNSS